VSRLGINRPGGTAALRNHRASNNTPRLRRRSASMTMGVASTLELSYQTSLTTCQHGHDGVVGSPRTKEEHLPCP
jgi:hypothetical protein